MKDQPITIAREFSEPFDPNSLPYIERFLRFESRVNAKEFSPSECIFDPADPFAVTLDFPETGLFAPKRVHYRCPAAYVIRTNTDVIVQFFFSNKPYKVIVGPSCQNHAAALKTAKRFSEIIGRHPRIKHPPVQSDQMPIPAEDLPPTGHDPLLDSLFPFSNFCTCVLSEGLRREMFLYVKQDLSSRGDLERFPSTVRAYVDPEQGSTACCTMAFLLYLCFICGDAEGFIGHLRTFLIDESTAS